MTGCDKIGIGRHSSVGRQIAFPTRASRVAAVVWAVLLTVTTVTGTGVAATAAGVSGTVTVRVDASATVGSAARNLVGFGATATPAELGPLRVRTYRIDASLQDLVSCPSGQLDSARVRALGQRVNALDEFGARVVLIIDYMPPCLAAVPSGDTGDPTRLPPRDPSRWQQLVTQLVHTLGPARAEAGKRPVRDYEVWNEPDLTFFRGTFDQFVSGLLLPEGRAVQHVAQASGLELQFGICGCALLATGWLPRLLAAAHNAGIPVGFLSWHWYGNYPFLGPDGREPGVPPALYAALAKLNPATTPQDFANQVAQVRASAQSILGHIPELMIDEWNLAAGGFDHRMDTNEGAAYQAAALAVLAAAGLDRALLYTAKDPQSLDADGHPLPLRYGGWGVLDRSGAHKPSWYTQWMWQHLGAVRLAAPQDPNDNVWSSAGRSARHDHVNVLVATFRATGATDRMLDLTVSALRRGRWRVLLYRVDTAHPGSTTPTEEINATVGRDRTLQLATPLPAQSVVLARITRTETP